MHLSLEYRGAVGKLCDAIEAGSLPPECLVVGAAGTGKTWGILMLLHLLSLRRPGMRLLICRKTRESLTESVLVTYEQEVLPLTGHARLAEGIKRRVRQTYTYPNGTEWIVGGLDKPSKMLSTSYDIGFINEAIELGEEDWETIRSRIGRPERSHGLNSLIGDTNPGISSHWLKARCDAGRCLSLHSHHRDNPAIHDGRRWTEAGEQYLTQLRSLTGPRRARLYEGKWAAVEGQWFPEFGHENVSDLAEYDPRFPVYCSVDSGVTTGAVWFQVRHDAGRHRVAVFADYLSEAVNAESVGRAVVVLSAQVCLSSRPRYSTDPAGGSRNPVGPTVIGEYERVGLTNPGGIDRWPVSSVTDSLAVVEGLIRSADGFIGLLIHPRCRATIAAFENYRRAKRQGQWLDEPLDPQHPHEDMIDALRGGLKLVLPDGRKPAPKFTRMPAGRVI